MSLQKKLTQTVIDGYLLCQHFPLYEEDLFINPVALSLDNYLAFSIFAFIVTLQPLLHKFSLMTQLSHQIVLLSLIYQLSETPDYELGTPVSCLTWLLFLIKVAAISSLSNRESDSCMSHESGLGICYPAVKGRSFL